MMFGTYEHNIDEKGRMIFPSKLREALGDSFIITRWMDNTLAAFSQEEFQNVIGKLNDSPMSESRELVHYLFPNATEAVPDKQGRILIPANLREMAGLTKDVTVIGAMNRAEIWDRERYRREHERVTAEVFNQKMSEQKI